MSRIRCGEREAYVEMTQYESRLQPYVYQESSKAHVSDSHHIRFPLGTQDSGIMVMMELFRTSSAVLVYLTLLDTHRHSFPI